MCRSLAFLKLYGLFSCECRTKHPMPFFTPWTKHPASICRPGQKIPCSFCHPGQNIPCHFCRPQTKTSHAISANPDKSKAGDQRQIIRLTRQMFPTYNSLFDPSCKMISFKMGVCNCSIFCCTLLYVHSSIAIILMGK